MAPGDERDLIEAVVTCEGNLHDPDFSERFQSLVSKLKTVLYTTSKKQPFEVRKIEPWNSVRVTISIPKEAAQRLRVLAQQGSNVLRQLGILSVQVEGDQVISLTLAGRFNEPQEVILRPSNESTESGTSVPNTSSRSPSSICSTLSSSSSTSSAAEAAVPVAGPSGVMVSLDVLSSSSSAFRSPNVVAPGGEAIPFPPKSTALGPRPTLGGPFPFASMAHAAHTIQRSENNSNNNAVISAAPNSTNVGTAPSIKTTDASPVPAVLPASAVGGPHVNNSATSLSTNPPTTPPPMTTQSLSAPVRKISSVSNNLNSVNVNVVSKPQPVLVTAMVNAKSNTNNNNNYASGNGSSNSQNNVSNNAFIPPSNPANVVVVVNSTNYNKAAQVQGDVKLNPSQQVQHLQHHSKLQTVLKTSSGMTHTLMKDKEVTPNPTAAGNPQLTSTGKPRQFLINPLTGHLEPMPSESSSDSDGDGNDGRPGLSQKGPRIKVSKGKDASSALAAWDKLSPPKPLKITLDALKINRLTGGVSSKRSREEGESSNSTKENSVGHVNNANSMDKVDKIKKLRLKIEKPESPTSYKMDVTYLKKSEKSAVTAVMSTSGASAIPATASASTSSVSSSSGSSAQPGTTSQPEVPRVPPLHISLRGKNAAVVVSPRRDDSKDSSAFSLHSGLNASTQSEKLIVSVSNPLKSSLSSLASKRTKVRLKSSDGSNHGEVVSGKKGGKHATSRPVLSSPSQEEVDDPLKARLKAEEKLNYSNDTSQIALSKLASVPDLISGNPGAKASLNTTATVSGMSKVKRHRRKSELQPNSEHLASSHDQVTKSSPMEAEASQLMKLLSQQVTKSTVDEVEGSGPCPAGVPVFTAAVESSTISCDIPKDGEVGTSIGPPVTSTVAIAPSSVCTVAVPAVSLPVVESADDIPASNKLDSPSSEPPISRIPSKASDIPVSSIEGSLPPVPQGIEVEITPKAIPEPSLEKKPPESAIPGPDVLPPSISVDSKSEVITPSVSQFSASVPQRQTSSLSVFSDKSMAVPVSLSLTHGMPEELGTSSAIRTVSVSEVVTKSDASVYPLVSHAGVPHQPSPCHVVLPPPSSSILNQMLSEVQCGEKNNDIYEPVEKLTELTEISDPADNTSSLSSSSLRASVQSSARSDVPPSLSATVEETLLSPGGAVNEDKPASSIQNTQIVISQKGASSILHRFSSKQEADAFGSNLEAVQEAANAECKAISLNNNKNEPLLSASAADKPSAPVMAAPVISCSDPLPVRASALCSPSIVTALSLAAGVKSEDHSAIPGEDSGIDSMDALSEKSPNQGESPVRKSESDPHFCDSSAPHACQQSHIQQTMKSLTPLNPPVSEAESGLNIQPENYELGLGGSSSLESECDGVKEGVKDSDLGSTSTPDPCVTENLAIEQALDSAEVEPVPPVVAELRREASPSPCRNQVPSSSLPSSVLSQPPSCKISSSCAELSSSDADSTNPVNDDSEVFPVTAEHSITSDNKSSSLPAEDSAPQASLSIPGTTIAPADLSPQPAEMDLQCQPYVDEPASGESQVTTAKSNVSTPPEKINVEGSAGNANENSKPVSEALVTSVEDEIMTSSVVPLAAESESSEKSLSDHQFPESVSELDQVVEEAMDITEEIQRLEPVIETVVGDVCSKESIVAVPTLEEPKPFVEVTANQAEIPLLEENIKQSVTRDHTESPSATEGNSAQPTVVHSCVTSSTIAQDDNVVIEGREQEAIVEPVGQAQELAVESRSTSQVEEVVPEKEVKVSLPAVSNELITDVAGDSTCESSDLVKEELVDVGEVLAEASCRTDVKDFKIENPQQSEETENKTESSQLPEKAKTPVEEVSAVSEQCDLQQEPVIDSSVSAETSSQLPVVPLIPDLAQDESQIADVPAKSTAEKTLEPCKAEAEPIISTPGSSQSVTVVADAHVTETVPTDTSVKPVPPAKEDPPDAKCQISSDMPASPSLRKVKSAAAENSTVKTKVDASTSTRSADVAATAIVFPSKSSCSKDDKEKLQAIVHPALVHVVNQDEKEEESGKEIVEKCENTVIPSVQQHRKETQLPTLTPAPVPARESHALPTATVPAHSVMPNITPVQRLIATSEQSDKLTNSIKISPSRSGTSPQTSMAPILIRPNFSSPLSFKMDQQNKAQQNRQSVDTSLPPKAEVKPKVNLNVTRTVPNVIQLTKATAASLGNKVPVAVSASQCHNTKASPIAVSLAPLTSSAGLSSTTGQPTVFAIHPHQYHSQSAITVLPGHKMVPIKLVTIPKQNQTQLPMGATRSSPTILETVNLVAATSRASSPNSSMKPKAVVHGNAVPNSQLSLGSVAGGNILVPISVSSANASGTASPVKVLVSSGMKVQPNLLQSVMVKGQLLMANQNQGHPTTIRVVRPLVQPEPDPPKPEPKVEKAADPPAAETQVEPTAVKPVIETTTDDRNQDESIYEHVDGVEVLDTEDGNDDEFAFTADIIHDEKDLADVLAGENSILTENGLSELDDPYDLEKEETRTISAKTSRFDSAEMSRSTFKQNSNARPAVNNSAVEENHPESDSECDKVDSPIPAIRASSPLYTYSMRSGRNSHSTSESRSPSPPEPDVHGEDQEIIDCLARSPPRAKLSPQNNPNHQPVEERNTGKHNADHTYGAGLDKSTKSPSQSPAPQLGQLSIEIPSVDLEVMSPATVEESKKSTRSTRSNTRLVSPDITAFRSDTPKPTKFTNKPDGVLLRNSPKPSPTGSMRTHSPGLSSIQASVSARASPVTNPMAVGSTCGLHPSTERNSPNVTSGKVSAVAGLVTKRKRQESDSSSASKDDNSEESKAEIDLNSRPGKRRCSENAAELIKACIGVEDTPKRNSSLLKKTEVQDNKPKENSGGKAKKQMMTVVEENEEDLEDGPELLSRGRGGGRSSRGSSEDRSSSRGSSANRNPVVSKPGAKEEEHKEIKANSRVINRTVPSKEVGNKSKPSGQDSPNANSSKKEDKVQSSVGRRSNRNALSKEKSPLAVVKPRSNVRKEPGTPGLTEKQPVASHSPENGNPRRKTRSSVAVVPDSSMPSFKRRRVSKDAKS